MRDIIFEKQTSHELSRVKIAQQIDRFVKEGGQIERVDNLKINTKLVAQGWKPRAGSFEN